MAAKGIVLEENEEWEEADDTPWKDSSHRPHVHPPAQERRGRVTFQGDDEKEEEDDEEEQQLEEPDEEDEEEEEEEEEDSETLQNWREEKAHEDKDGGIEDEGGVILDGKQEVQLDQAEDEDIDEDENEDDEEEAGDEEYDGEADDNDWQEEAEEEDEEEPAGDKKSGDKRIPEVPHKILSVQEKTGGWPSPIEAADTGPRRWVSVPRVNASRKEVHGQQPGHPQSLDRSTGNKQGVSTVSMGANNGSAHLQGEIERLNKENWTLRLEIGQERYRVQQLEGLKEQAAQARQRELEARRAQAIAVHELEQAQGSADRRDEFTKSERAQLLQHIEDLERSTQEVRDRDNALRLQLQEALADRAGAKDKEDAAARELARWKKEALDQAAKLKQAEQRLQQLEQKHTEDKAKIKALTTQLRSCVAATAESADNCQPSKPISPGHKDIDPVKPRRKFESPVRRTSGRQPQQGSGRGGATLESKEHRQGAANDWVTIGGQVCAGMATAASGIASRARMVTGGIVRWAWRSFQRFSDPMLVENGVPGVAGRAASKGGRGGPGAGCGGGGPRRRATAVAPPQVAEPHRGAPPQAFAHVRAGGPDDEAAAKQMQVLGALVVFIIGMAVVKLLV